MLLTFAEMAKPATKRHSFFKVMVGDFKTQLLIPPAFKKHLSNLRDKSVLRSPDGGLWPVKVCRTGGDGGWPFFQDGWDAYVADHSIAIGEFLVFHYDGGIGFDVTIYGKSGCEKESVAGNPGKAIVTCLPAEPQNPLKPNHGSPGLTMVSSNAQRERILEAARSFKTIHPRFIAACKKSNHFRVRIPSAFVREYSLLEKESMVLQNLVGYSWHVKITCNGDGRAILGAGWLDFRRGNCLGEGDVCVFEFVQGGNEMHVHIFRVKEDTEEMVGKSGVEEDSSEVVTKSGSEVCGEKT